MSGIYFLSLHSLNYGHTYGCMAFKYTASQGVWFHFGECSVITIELHYYLSITIY